jgi:hypothetical protein
MTDPITAALRHKQARKAALNDLLRGRRQPRDELGRFAAIPSSGFDGGARTPAPVPRDPVRDHDQLIWQLANVSRTFRGGHGF